MPRQKYGVFAEKYNRWIETHPKATHVELRDASQQIWNRVDATLGQVVYDRLFIHNVAKNFMQMLIRAPGWTGGTIVDVGGGLIDLADYARKTAVGKRPLELTDRAAYTLSMLATTAMVNAVLTALFTQKQPDDWRDLVAFRTGNLDEHGRPERFLLPTYAKDVYAYSQAPLTTLVHKTHPLLSTAGELASNKTYYGTEIRSEDAGLLTQLGQVAAHGAAAFVPFWVRGLQKENERGGSSLAKAAPMIGVMPAPSAMNQTTAEKLMSKYAADRVPQGARTVENEDKSNAMRGIYVALRKGEKDRARELYEQAHDEHILRPIDYAKALASARKEPLVNSFKKLTYSQASRVMEVATPEEKQKLDLYYRIKRNKEVAANAQRGLTASN